MLKDFDGEHHSTSQKMLYITAEDQCDAASKTVSISYKEFTWEDLINPNVIWQVYISLREITHCTNIDKMQGQNNISLVYHDINMTYS